MYGRRTCWDGCLKAETSIGNRPKNKRQVEREKKNYGNGNIQSRRSENHADQANIFSIADFILLNRMPIEMQGRNDCKSEGDGPNKHCQLPFSCKPLDSHSGLFP